MNTDQISQAAHVIFVLVLSGFIGLCAGLFSLNFFENCSGQLACAYDGPARALMTGILVAFISAVILLVLMRKKR